MSLAQRRLVDPLVIMREYAMTDQAADPVIDRIAADRRDDQQRDKQPFVHRPGCAKCATDEQQRVARQERQDHQPGFTKHDGKQHPVDHGAVLFNDGTEVFVDMQNHVEKLHEIHSFSDRFPRASYTTESPRID